MLDLSLMEIGVIGLVAIVVIGPKQMPTVLRSVGKGIKQVRNLAGDFRDQLEAMAEDEDSEDKLEESLAEYEADMEFIEGDDGNRYAAYDITELMEEDRAKRRKDTPPGVEPGGSAGEA